MSRACVAVMVGLLVGACAPDADAASRAKSSSAQKKKATAAAKAKAKAKARAKAKRSRLARSKSKRSSKGTRVAVATKVSTSMEGMPSGWRWPPDAPMKLASVACEKELDGLGIRWERASPEGKMVDPVYVPGMEIGGIRYVSAYRRGPHRLDCQLVHTLATVGPALYALGVREVTFGSIFRNTNVRAHGQTRPILSRHALGIAMDIKSFTDDQGRVASVELDYLKGDALLHGIEDALNRTEKFRAVLTPGNDPISHYDHFHIEAVVDYAAFR